MVDGSSLPIEENIKLSSSVVARARVTGCLVEAEVGVLAGIEDDILSDNPHLAKVEDVERLFAETGVDLLAPAIGNVHGHYIKEKGRLDFSKLAQLSKRLTCFLVLHGGSGLTGSELGQAIDLGVVKVNLSTVLKDVFSGIKEVDPWRHNLMVANGYSRTIEHFLHLLRTDRLHDFDKGN